MARSWESAERHTIQRLFQRCGLVLSIPEYRALVHRIIAGLNPAIAPARAGGTLHRVRIRGVDVHVVFRDGVIVTALQGIPQELRRAS